MHLQLKWLWKPTGVVGLRWSCFKSPSLHNVTFNFGFGTEGGLVTGPRPVFVVFCPPCE